MVSAWLLGPVFGVLAAAIGTALADLLLGYAVYMPATFVIKGLMALVAFYTYKTLSKKPERRVIKLFVSAILAELIMVCGYFVFEAFVLSYGVGAAASILGNTMQAISGVIGSVILYTALCNTKLFRRYL